MEEKESKYGLEEDEAAHDLTEEVFTYEGLFNTKDKRVEAVDPEDCPPAYSENSRKEELCLEYVDNFLRQFEALFPERKKLFVTPKNECGVPKFVCNTMRPTQLPFKQLYNVSAAADFFSHFIEYEPLANPVEPPECLPSATFTLGCQVGDCFDISNLLCSYLIGSGFDAYCVYGYAPRDTTLLNRTKETCPLLQKKDLKDLSLEEETDDIVLTDLRVNQNDALKGTKQEEEINWSEFLASTAPQGTSQSQGEGTGEGKTGDDGESKIDTGNDITDGDDFVDNETNVEGKIDDGNNDQDAAESGERSGEEKSGEATGEAGENMDGGAGGSSAKVDGEDIDEATQSGEFAGDSAVPAALDLPIGNREQKEDVDPYEIDFSGIKESAYQSVMRERADFDMEEKGGEDEEETPDDEGPDSLEGQRIHCWILVRAGKRMVDQSFFVEPTTGKLYHVYGSPYLGVEAVWNHKNYWVNMQQDGEDKMNISYNLEMEENWEYIFVDDMRRGNKRDAMNEEVDPTLSPDEDTGAVTVDTGAGMEEKEGKDMILDLPPSWVEKLVLSRDAFRRRYNTTGQRTQLFWKSKLESNAEHLHPHGLVKRLVLFQDKARTLPVEVLEYFANRRDKLVLRVRYPLEGRVIEHFAEGRASGLKSINEETGKTRNIVFYSGARLDGLVERFEEIGEKIVERFENRDDHMETRSIRLKPQGGDDGANGARGRGATFHRSEEKKSDVGLSKVTYTLPRAHQGGDLTIVKMKQVFSRNWEKEADQDISKRTFSLSEANISVIYHYAKGRITRSTRTFFKDPSCPPDIKMSGAFDQPLRPSEIEEEFQAHLQAEKNCYQSIRDGEREVQDILGLRKREESNIVLEKSIFDTASEKAKQDNSKQAENQVQEEKDPRHVDYLTPFLQHISNLDKIKRDEAETARDACLKSLKERLLERANIIQCRLDEENAQLAKKQAAFQRSRDHVDGADQEFERFCSEAMFRIQILEQRLARHEESALSIYANLDQKLRNDPRIAILYSN